MVYTSKFSVNSLVANCDRAFPSGSTTWGYLTFLSEPWAVDLTFEINLSTNVLTAVDHQLATGSRVLINSTTSIPIPLVGGQEYFAIVLSPDTLSLASTLANALAGTAIDLTTADPGGGFTLSEQVLNETDSAAVLINREISHPSFTSRIAISNLAAAQIDGLQARKNAPVIEISNTSTTDDINFRHMLLIESPVLANATLGNVPTAGLLLLSSNSLESIPANGTANVALSFACSNF